MTDDQKNDAGQAEKQEKQLPAEQAKQRLQVQDEGSYSAFFDSARFEQLQRIAKVFAASKMVPEHFRGKDADCIIAVEMASRLNADPFALMQALYVVHGKPGFEAKFVIGLMNTRGPFEGPIQWTTTGEGKNRAWTAYAKHRQTGERCDATVTWAMAEAEGWVGKAGSKWKTMPDIMGRYRSAMFLARLFCPEVLMGMQSIDELHDIGEVQSRPAVETKSLADLKDGEETGFGFTRSKRQEIVVEDEPEASDEQTETTPEPDASQEAEPEDTGGKSVKTVVAAYEAFKSAWREFHGVTQGRTPKACETDFEKAMAAAAEHAGMPLNLVTEPDVANELLNLLASKNLDIGRLAAWAS